MHSIKYLEKDKEKNVGCKYFDRFTTSPQIVLLPYRWNCVVQLKCVAPLLFVYHYPPFVCEHQIQLLRCVFVQKHAHKNRGWFVRCLLCMRAMYANTKTMKWTWPSMYVYAVVRVCMENLINKLEMGRAVLWWRMSAPLENSFLFWICIYVFWPLGDAYACAVANTWTILQCCSRYFVFCTRMFLFRSFKRHERHRSRTRTHRLATVVGIRFVIIMWLNSNFSFMYCCMGKT